MDEAEAFEHVEELSPKNIAQTLLFGEIDQILEGYPSCVLAGAPPRDGLAPEGPLSDAPREAVLLVGVVGESSFCKESGPRPAIRTSAPTPMARLRPESKVLFMLASMTIERVVPQVRMDSPIVSARDGKEKPPTRSCVEGLGKGGRAVARG